MPARPTNRTEQRVVAQRYALDDRLGRGGMGTVWRAHDQLLQRAVAVKEIELPSSLGDDGEKLKARIMREARTAAALSHPNVVTMFDVIEESGHAYIVMELVDAPSLSEILHEKGPVSPEVAARIGLGILGALEAAHAAGIVHRDVKPSNVMVDGTNVKLADFGIATVTGDPKLTDTGLILGSPSYMAPEQARGEGAGPATDLWGLGVTLYTAVDGRGPFERGEPIPTLTAIVQDEPQAPSGGGALAPTIMRLLQKDPADRPTIPAVRRALEDLAAGGGPGTTAVMDAGTATAVEREARPEPTPEPMPAPEPRRAAPATRRPSWGWLAALAAIVLAVAAILWLPDLLASDPSADRSTENGQTPAQNEGGGNQDEGASDEGSTGDGQGSSAVPEGWELYTDPSTGYRIAHPADWAPQRIDTRTDFVAPNGDYLRVDYVSPPGGDTQEAHIQSWEAQSESFASRYPDYEEISIEGLDFRGWPGALWEYSYEDRHAYNLGFTPSADYGFALNLVASEGSWEDVQDEWEAFQASFEPPA